MTTIQTPPTLCRCGHEAKDHVWSELTRSYRCAIHTSHAGTQTLRWCPCETYRWNGTQPSRRKG